MRWNFCQALAPSSSAASYSDGEMVCSPASSVMATNGMPRQILATTSEPRAFHGEPEEVDVGGAQMQHVHQQVGDDRELRIVDPPPCDRRQHGGHYPRQQHDGADERLERDVVVQQQCQPEAEQKFTYRRDDRVHDRIGHRHPEHRVLGERDEIIQPDEVAGLADRRVGQRQPQAEAERIGEEHDQQPGGGQHAQCGQERLVVEQLGQPAVRPARHEPNCRCSGRVHRPLPRDQVPHAVRGPAAPPPPL